MSQSVEKVYELIEKASTSEALVKQVILGLTWTGCQVAENVGFAQSPGIASRVLEFPGTLAGRSASELVDWIRSWNPFEATIGLATANACINVPSNPLMREAQPLAAQVAPNLAVFEYFRPRLAGKKVVVIGRYPGLDKVLGGLDVTVLERQPGEQDLPDPAAEYVLPQADWVFLTATSLINKTFPRLAQLASQAVTVLMGPSTPWLAELAEFDIDYLAGTVTVDQERAMTIAAEGGGTRLFGEGMCYAIADIGVDRMQHLKARIAETAAARGALNKAMEAWYAQGQKRRFPQYAELEQITRSLSQLDTCYKRQWDARNTA